MGNASSSGNRLHDSSNHLSSAARREPGAKNPAPPTHQIGSARDSNDAFDEGAVDHADPELVNLPTVNPMLHQPRIGESNANLLVTDGRGEDTRRNFDHLAGAPDADASNVNPRYQENYKHELRSKQAGHY
jgi:hypothetical protein